MPMALALFVKYAYAILFGWVLLEQLGVPVPSIPLLITAGTLTATHRLHTMPAIGAVLAACALADSTWYMLGRRFGGRVLHLLCRFSFESSTCVNKTELYFSRRGALTLLFAKFVPGLSTVAAPIAGQTGMTYQKFLMWDMAGSLVWSLGYALAGRFFGDLARRSARFFALLGHFAVILFVLAVAGLVLYRYLRNRRLLREIIALRLEPAELMEKIDQARAAGEPPPFVVDLRHPLDYLPAPRVLPGTVRISPGELERRSDVLPRDRDVVLYCTCPNEETSAKLAMQLHKLGVSRVRPLRGGFDGWKQAGYPLLDYVEEEAMVLVASR